MHNRAQCYRSPTQRVIYGWSAIAGPFPPGSFRLATATVDEHLQGDWLRPNVHCHLFRVYLSPLTLNNGDRDPFRLSWNCCCDGAERDESVGGGRKSEQK